MYLEERNLAKGFDTEKVPVKTGDAEVSLREIQWALAFHRGMGDVARESEDLRALARALEMLGQPAQAEATLRELIARGKRLEQPLLTAKAERDLARLLHRQERNTEAVELASRARDAFATLGATVEVRRLEALLRELQ